MSGLAIVRDSVQAGFNQPRPDLEVSFHNHSREAKASNYSVLIVENRDEIHAHPKYLGPARAGHFDDFTEITP